MKRKTKIIIILALVFIVGASLILCISETSGLVGKAVNKLPNVGR